MSKWRVKKGNASIQEIPIKDRNGNLLSDTDLTNAASIDFMVKVNAEDTDANAKIAKDKADGIAVNQPLAGWIEITIKPADTALAVGFYKMACEIDLGSNQKYEVVIKIDGVETDTFEIAQDVIRGA